MLCTTFLEFHQLTKLLTITGGGDVAFVKHTTVRENTDGRNIAEWSRNRRSDDYELLCNDGTRKDIDQWESCNMGEIPANAIVTAGGNSFRLTLFKFIHSLLCEILLLMVWTVL